MLTYNMDRHDKYLGSGSKQNNDGGFRLLKCDHNGNHYVRGLQHEIPDLNGCYQHPDIIHSANSHQQRLEMNHIGKGRSRIYHKTSDRLNQDGRQPWQYSHCFRNNETMFEYEQDTAIGDHGLYQQRFKIEDQYNELPRDIGEDNNSQRQCQMEGRDPNNHRYNPRFPTTNPAIPQHPPVTDIASPTLLDNSNRDGEQSNTVKDCIKERNIHIDYNSHRLKYFQKCSFLQTLNQMLNCFFCFIFSLMRVILYRSTKIKVFSSVLYFILFILSNTSQVSSSSPSSSSSSSSLSPSKLHINVVVAQSCQETFLLSLKSKIDAAIDDFKRNEIGDDVQGEFQLTSSVFPQCSSDSVLNHLTEIFGNDTTNSVVALASYDIHASFIPLAEIFQKAYIVCNNHVSNPLLTSPTFAPFPSFAQEALMLAKILDMYRWQHVYVIHTEFRYWLDFSTTLYYTLTSQQFYVTLAKVDLNVADDASRILQNVGTQKVIVLLMDVSDQEEILAMASSLSMTTKHVIFAFSDSPYDVTSRSLIGLSKEDASLSKFSNDPENPGVNILESVFVIGPSFPTNGHNSTTGQSSQNDNVRTRRKRHAHSPPLMFRSELNTLTETGQRAANAFDSHLTEHDFVSDTEYKTDSAQQSSENNIRKGTPSQFSHTHYKTGSEFQNSPTKSTLSHRDTNLGSYNGNYIGSEKELTAPSKSNFRDDDRSFIITTSKPRSSKVLATPVLDDDNDRLHRSPLKREDVLVNGDESRKSGQNINVLQFRSEFNTNAYENNNYDFSPSNEIESDQLENDYFFFNKRSNANTNTKYLDRGGVEKRGEEIIESRSKREIHDFKTVQSDLDAVYDVVYLLASAAYDNYRSGRARALDSRYLISELANISFSGATGTFDVRSDLQVSFDFAVYDFNTSSSRLEPRIFLEAVSTFSSEWTLKDQQGISWPGRVILRGDECFKEKHLCDEEGFQTAYIITIVIATVALVFIVIFIITLLRRYLTNKEMFKGPNKILMTSADLVFIYKKDVGKSSRTMMKSRGTLTEKENTPDIIRASDPTSRSMPSLNDLNDGFTQTARYNGDLVHVKELDIEGFEMKSKLLTYIRMLRDLRHENINPYVGFMVERENKPALVMEYCSRGNLHDMIHNDDIKLDWDFKLSLLTDLVRGMRYLHSTTLKFHGHLTSHNCVIDSRFVLKITTYGVSGIMERCKAARTMDAKDCLWSAPEMLRDPLLLQKGSDKGDIYSIAIIFQEVTLRSEPYSTTGLTPDEIVRKLKKPPPLIRPSVTPQAAPPQFIQIMKQCWAEMPEMRPSLDEIYDQFKKLTGGKKANIVDTMFKMLEKYSNDLEDIVAERTMQLEEEKKKTDQLLFRMLPSTVAEALKLGQTVEAETFSEASIYFSDIVGFTTISAMSTPMQVVDLLNDLYTMFDATIDNYDVYKVETIGDAYMVASGLPIKNGNRHAGEISTMALMLLSQCGEFTIRHMPHVPLRLRIGLHTGSCVAGVVGLTMPRFCLFGDTVNTASRMESTGAAFRIHISEACKGVLDVLGGYKVVYRGKTELKGKGKQNTYWLVGKEGLDKELPEPPPLVGGDNHGLESLLRHMESDPSSTTQKPVGTVSPTKSTSAPDLATPITSPQPPACNNNNSNGDISNSNNALLPVPDSANNNLLTASSVSQPAKLDNLETLHKETCKLSDQNQIISVVKADVHDGVRGCLGRGQNQNQNDAAVVGGANTDKTPAPDDEGLEVDADNRLVDEIMDASLVGMETVKNEYNNHHSESNDSGFGSERKHSQGQEFNSGFHPCSSSSAANPDKVKRNSSLSSMTSLSNRTSVISSSDVTLNHHVTLTSEGHEETLAPVSEV